MPLIDEQPVSPWRPVLDSAGVTRVRTAAQALAGSWAASDALPATAYDSALRALLLAYLPEDWRPTAPDESMRHLQAAIDCLETEDPPARLHGGLTGTATLIAHVQERLCGPNAEDLIEGVDDHVQAILSQTPWRGPYDLIDGVIGLGTYGLCRMPRAAGRAIVVQVLGHLRALAVPVGDGWAWSSPTADAPRTWGQLPGDYYWDTGMAHGISGVVAFAASAILAGISGAGAEVIVDRASAFLESLAAKSHSATNTGTPATLSLPIFATLDHCGPAPPAAWCYGQPGRASALVLAAEARDAADWRRAAAAIAAETFNLDQPCAGATLCHGASGLSLIALRLRQVTGLTLLGDRAAEWARRALDNWNVDGHLDAAVITPNELLTGRVGALLALLAAATSTEPTWDRLLLLPRGQS